MSNDKDRAFRTFEDFSPTERVELRARVLKLQREGRMGSRDAPPASARAYTDPLPLIGSNKKGR